MTYSRKERAVSRSTRLGRRREREGRGGDTKTSMEEIIEFVVEELERMQSPVSLLQLWMSCLSRWIWDNCAKSARLCRYTQRGGAKPSGVHTLVSWLTDSHLNCKLWACHWSKSKHLFCGLFLYVLILHYHILYVDFKYDCITSMEILSLYVIFNTVGRISHFKIQKVDSKQKSSRKQDCFCGIRIQGKWSLHTYIHTGGKENKWCPSNKNHVSIRHFI